MSVRRKLDTGRPYGHVYGLIGVQYEQDGINFNAGGDEVMPAQIEHIDDERTPPSPRDDTPIFPATVMDSPPPVEEPNAALEGRHWKHLKVMVETYGGEWTTKEDAINFLRGKKL